MCFPELGGELGEPSEPVTCVGSVLCSAQCVIAATCIEIEEALAGLDNAYLACALGC
jgi:hypothetical protein